VRPVAHTCVLSLLIFSASSFSSVASLEAPIPARFERQHARIIVGFFNVPLRPPGLAGATGWRYNGNGYQVAQSAHRTAQLVAAAFGLRMVASWPIKTLAVHCVVYEIPDSRPASELVAALMRDPRVALAQPLQQFHTQGSRH
jgi:hypothetical protein